MFVAKRTGIVLSPHNVARLAGTRLIYDALKNTAGYVFLIDCQYSPTEERYKFILYHTEDYSLEFVVDQKEIYMRGMEDIATKIAAQVLTLL